MVWIFVGMIAAALVTLATYERTRRRHKRATALWAASTKIGMMLAGRFGDVDSVAETIRSLVPEFADWAILHTVENQQVRRAAIAHVDAGMEQRMRDAFARTAFVADAPTGPAHVFRTGKPFLSRKFTPTVVDSQPDPQLLRDAGLGSWISVPMTARHDIVGVLTIARRAARAYDEQDLAWAQDLAHRFGLAVENHRLYGESRDLFEQSASANFVSTPDGRMLACNQRFAELHGCESTEEVLARRAQSFYVDARERERFLRELRKHKRVGAFETSMVHAQGHEVPVSISAVGAFDERDELVRITGFVLDRSAQRDLEEQLRQAQRLEAVGQLAGGIAHDFNNLLTVIIGCTDLLRAEVPPAARVVDGHDPIEELAKAAARAASLTQQLLAFSRRQVLQPRVIDFNEAVRNTHSMLGRLLRNNVVLTLDLDSTLPPVRVDPTQIDQVIMNLVVNASDAMPSGGTLTITTANATLGDDEAQRHGIHAGSYVRLTVRDTGTGMDDATRARVFEPFFTTKPVGKGTGLGLSTVYGIVKQSGGGVALTSAPGSGTSVDVYLPNAVVPEAAQG